MNEPKRKISIVVPFLNEQENLPVLYERVQKVFAELPESWELLLVDDGSTDHSPRWAAETALKDSRVKLLRLSRNFGHQIAITAGLDHADGDAAVIMDADLQDPPEVIPDLLKAWREGAHVVYGVRKERQGETWLKKFLAAAFYRIFRRLARVEVPVNAGDFRLVDRQVVHALKQVRELHRFMRGLTCWVGFRNTAVYYSRAPRLAGQTKYPVWKSLRLALDAVTSFSGAPLRWVMGAGVAVSIAGLLFAARLVVIKWFNINEMVPGWTSQVTILLLVSGVQLICLGVMGQYVSRIFEESKKRPLYFIMERVGWSDPEALRRR
jgi:glycosyltransferase involved in cell wall biosynthesis